MEKNSTYSYENVFIRYEDPECLKDYNQLNDICISFYFEWLANKINCKDLIFLDPAMVINIYFDDSIEDLQQVMGFLDLKSKKYIFIPLNDSQDRFKVGSGMHWSLLIYSVVDNLFFYIDSTSSYISSTDNITEKLIKIIFNETKQIIIHKIFTGIQSNSYDCGMFVLMFSEALATHLSKSDEFDQELINKILGQIQQKDVLNKRKEIYDLIKSFKVK